MRARADATRDAEDLVLALLLHPRDDVDAPLLHRARHLRLGDGPVEAPTHIGVVRGSQRDAQPSRAAAIHSETFSSH